VVNNLRRRDEVEVTTKFLTSVVVTLRASATACFKFALSVLVGAAVEVRVNEVMIVMVSLEVGTMVGCVVDNLVADVGMVVGTMVGVVLKVE
jgi:hypothetical protein